MSSTPILDIQDINDYDKLHCYDIVITCIYLSGQPDYCDFLFSSHMI